MSGTDEEVARVLACDDSDAKSILGVDAEASDADIKKAYRKLALKVHPDKCEHKDARYAFAKVGGAYRRLMGEEDEVGQAGGGRPATYEDAEELFREFMKSNPTFRAGFQAGMGSGSADVDGANLNDMFSGKFSFSRAGLAIAWGNGAAYIRGKPLLTQVLLVPLGIIAYALAAAFTYTLPWSLIALVLGGVGMVFYFGFRIAWWFWCHLPDLIILAFTWKRLRNIWPSTIVMLAVEYATGATIFGNLRAWPLPTIAVYVSIVLAGKIFVNSMQTYSTK